MACLADHGSFSRTPQILKSFELPTPRIRVWIAWAIETESYLFLGKRIVAQSSAAHINLVTIALIALCRFSLLPSHLPLPSSFTAQWLAPLFMPPLLPVPHRLAPMTQGTTLGRKALQWRLLLQLMVPQEWRRGRFLNSPTSSRRQP
jgi:hypothetical protein